MTKIKLALASRTFWTLVAIFFINTVHANSGVIPVQVMDALNPLLILLATYFKVYPSQDYSTPVNTSNPNLG